MLAGVGGWVEDGMAVCAEVGVEELSCATAADVCVLVVVWRAGVGGAGAGHVVAACGAAWNVPGRPESDRVGDWDCVTRQLEEECFRLWVKLERREGCWHGGSGEAQREETVSGV